MRYIVIAAISLVSVLFSGSVFTNLNLFGIEPDLMLAAMTAMVMLEKSLTPVFYMSSAAFLLDTFFSHAIGFYVLQYLVTGIVLYIFGAKKNLGILGVALTGGVLWVVRDIVGFLLCVLIENPVAFGKRLWSSTLPGAFIAVLLTFVLYFLVEKLYERRFMWPVPPHFEGTKLM